MKKKLSDVAEVTHDNNFILKVKNRNKYRLRLRIYKKLWFYSLVFIDYLKERIEHYTNKNIN